MTFWKRLGSKERRHDADPASARNSIFKNYLNNPNPFPRISSTILLMGALRQLADLAAIGAKPPSEFSGSWPKAAIAFATH